MAALSFSWKSYLLRFLLAWILVFSTYNPHLSYLHWLFDGPFNALKAFVGVILIIGWAIALRATWLSLGKWGVVFTAAFYGLMFWLIVDLLPKMNSIILVQYILLFIVTFILATGISWSHIHRRLTGQIDVDDVEQ